MASHLEDIVALEQALVELHTLEETLAGVPESMREIHDEYGVRREQIESFETTIQEAESAQRLASGAAQDAQEKLNRYEQQINQVTTQREYGALLQEIDTAKAAIQTAEDQGNEAKEQAQEASESLSEAKSAFEELERNYKVEQEKWEAEKPNHQERAQTLQQSIDALRERIPRNVAGMYDRIRSRHTGGALAEVVLVERTGKGPRMYACGACNYRIRPQVVVQIRTEGEITQCESCKRLLFVRNEE